MDNNVLNPTYQLFNAGGVYYNPGLSGFFQFGINDLMEDYKIIGGFILAGDPASTIGIGINSYFLTYENLRRRLDKRLTFYRQSKELQMPMVILLKQ